MKKHGIRHIPGMEIHHIDLNPSNNNPANLFQIDHHGRLHNQLSYLFEGWCLGSQKDRYFHPLVAYLINTGELGFDREIPSYYFNPFMGGELYKFREVLRSCDIDPPLYPESIDVVKRKVFVLKPAAELLKAIAFEWSVK